MKLEKVIPEVIKYGKPFVNINHKGYISLSTALVRETGLCDGDLLSMYQDKDRPKDWYMRKEKEGELKLRASKGNKGGGLIAQSTSLARTVLKSIGVESRGAVIPVATKPIEGGYYALLTAGMKRRQL